MGRRAIEITSGLVGLFLERGVDDACLPIDPVLEAQVLDVELDSDRGMIRLLVESPVFEDAESATLEDAPVHLVRLRRCATRPHIGIALHAEGPPEYSAAPPAAFELELPEDDRHGEVPGA